MSDATTLSAAGARRRQDMRAALQAIVVARGRRRRHAALYVVAVVVLAAAAVWPLAGGLRRSPLPPPAPAVAPRIVGDDVVRCHRWLVVDRPVAVARLLGDDELGAWLRAAGRPSGRIRVGGALLLEAELGP